MTAGVFVLFPGAGFLWAQVQQPPEQSTKKTEVIQTKIDFDQMVMPDADSQPSGKSTANSGSAPSATTEAVSSPADTRLTEQQMLRLSQNLKNAINENKELLTEKERILDDLKQLRGQREIETNRMTALTQERDELKKRLEETVKTGEDQTKKVQELQTSMDQKTKEWDEKTKKLENQLALQEKWNQEMEEMKTSIESQPAVAQAVKSQNVESGLKECDEKTLNQLMTKLNDLNQENDKLRNESAKVHYNLGNIFFKQGDYARAAIEYNQSVELTPFDAENPYNLAFVSGEFLNDSKTALKHYQQYLFLNPHAKDAVFVKEKILKARMDLKATMDSPLNEKSKIQDNY